MVHFFGQYSERKPPLGLPLDIENSAVSLSQVSSKQPRAWVLVAGTRVLRHFNHELKELSQYLGRRLACGKYGLISGQHAIPIACSRLLGNIVMRCSGLYRKNRL